MSPCGFRETPHGFNVYYPETNNIVSIHQREHRVCFLQASTTIIWDVVFECDCRIVFKALTNNSELLVTVANIIMTIQQKLQEFRMVQVCHVKQQGNQQWQLQEFFSRWSLRNLNYTKSNKKRVSYNEPKKKQKNKKQIHKVLQFPSTNFLVLKSLYDILIMNAANYISFKILNE